MPQKLGTYKLALSGAASSSIDLTNTLYCPESSVNLISVSQLAKEGVKFVFDQAGATALFNNAVVLTASLRGKLYVINEPDTSAALALAAFSVDSPSMSIWHRRLAHLGNDSL